MPQIPMPYTVHLDHTLRVTPMNTLFAKGDSDAHRFELTILRAGMPEDLNGCAVFGKFYRMADSTVVSVPGSVEDGKAVVVLDAACYDYIGRFALTIAIKKGEDKTTVFYGDGYMHGQRADTAISGEYIIYDIDTLLEKIAEIDAATQAANTATENANTAASNANTARDAANTAASTANTAATNANTAKDTANAAAGKINNMTVSATPVSTGTATAELTTVDGHYHLALGLPKGNTGATPRISVQVQTGEAGSEASVSISGTAEEPVIHLTIPRGDVGDIGALTINGKTPDGSGAVTLTPGDLGAATAEEVSSLKDDIGDAWASGTTYAVGDYCISGNQLYKCKTAHTAGSAFNSSYWDAVSVTDEIKSIDYKSYFSGIVTGITILDYTRITKRGNMIYGTLHFKTTEEISTGTSIINLPTPDGHYYCFAIFYFGSKAMPYADGMLSTYGSTLKYYGVSNLPADTYCAFIQYLSK